VNAKIADRLAPATIGAMIQVGINPQSPAFPNLIAPVIGTASGHVTGALTGILIGGGVPPQNAASAVATIYAAVGNAYGESYRYAFIILAPPAFVVRILLSAHLVRAPIPSAGDHLRFCVPRCEQDDELLGRRPCAGAPGARHCLTLA
jgi:hypothetical protein